MLKEFWLKISTLGVDASTSAHIGRRIIISNWVYSASAIILLFSMGINTVFGPLNVNLILVSCMILLSVGLVLNYYRKTVMSRILYIVWTNVMIMLFSLVYDHNTQEEVFLFVSLTSVFVLFDFREKASLFSGMAICAMSYAFIMLTRNVDFLRIPQSVQYIRNVRIMNIFSSISLSTLYILLLVAETSRMRDSLEEEKEISDSILNASADTIMLMDQHFRLISFNRHAEEALLTFCGIKLEKGADIIEEFKKTSFTGMVSLWQNLRKQAQEGKSICQEVRGTNLNGATNLEITLNPFRREGSREFCTAIFIKNINSRKQAEAELKKYQKLISNSNDIMLLVDSVSYSISDVNECALRTLGYTREQLLGRTFPEIKRRISEEHTWTDFLQNKAGNQLYECHLICKDGHEILVESNISEIEHNDLCYIMIVSRDITKRKEYENKISEQREYLNQIINSSPNLIWVKDAAGRYKMVNKSIAELYNTDPESMVGKRDSDFGLREEEVTFYNHVDTRVLESLKTSNYYDETFTNPVTNEKHWYNIIKAPIISGNTIDVLGIAIDIGDRKKLEMEVQELNNLQKAIIDCTDNSIISTDLQGVITSFNKKSEELLGFMADEVVGKVKPDIFLDKTEFYTRSIELSREFGRSVEPGLESLTIKANLGISEWRQWTIIRKNGSTFTASCQISLLKNTAGEPIGYLIIASDVTEKLKIELQIQKIAEAEKRQSFINNGIAELSEVLRMHFNDSRQAYARAVSFLIQYMGAHQGCLFISHGNKNGKLKLAASYALGMNPKFLKSVKIGEGFIGQAALDQKTIVIRDVADTFVTIGTGGSIAQPRSIAIVPLVFEEETKGVLEIAALDNMPDENVELLSRAAGVLAATIDLDNRKAHTEHLLAESQKLNLRLRQQEEILLSQKHELMQSNEAIQDKASLLEIRNIDLENARKALKVKAEELEVNNRYKTEFLANMSHELRTPLNSILILSNLMLENTEKNLTDKQKQFAQVIHRSGADLLNLINDVLDLAKIEAGKIELMKEQFPVSDLAEDMRMIFQEVANERHILFNLDCTSQVIVHDRVRIGQILKNLLSNAFKFTPAGGEVTLSIHMAGPEYLCRNTVLQYIPKLLLRVSDTGIGIAAEKQQLIFEAFSQADGSTSRKYGGTGLGLSISRELALLMNGEIHLESKEGEGSTFELLLPLESEMQGLPELSSVQGEEEESTYPSGKMLIIENDLCHALALKALAEVRGFHVVLAQNGEEGLAWAEKEDLSAVLLNIHLPDMDGWRVLRALKAGTSQWNNSVYTMSDTDYSRHSREAGADGFILKEKEEFDHFRKLFDRLSDEIQKKKCHALIIEDSLVQSEQIKTLLSARLLHSDIALTGQYALELLRKNNYDLVVLDLNLPDTDGANLLRKIRGSHKHGNVRIIVYTGLTLSPQKYKELSRYSNTIIQKTSTSNEQLLAETMACLQEITSGESPDIKEINGLYGSKVLLVDDDMRNIFALSSVLQAKGVEVVVANDGREALDMLHEHPDTNAVLLDMMMPVMNGYETAQAIRLIPGLDDLPVISLTANAMKGDREKCLAAGVSDYLTKPVRSEDVLRTLDRWINRIKETNTISLK